MDEGTTSAKPSTTNCQPSSFHTYSMTSSRSNSLAPSLSD
ncbi:uncharacterized protein G2W53_026299 [Senna tora]|uniref:Uncharacterized protein n=1 Tax=Senna tora TaxID=362788 RepID=A0A834TNN9_9FABA|nr:uncharacterized protein G2W53_026299 [Senna tora]